MWSFQVRKELIVNPSNFAFFVRVVSLPSMKVPVKSGGTPEIDDKFGLVSVDLKQVLP